MHKAEATIMDEIVAVAKRRGFIYPGSEIYGGLANTWDYGPYGSLLKNNVKAAWWADMVMKRADIVGIDTSILLNTKAWEASGHLANFTDPLVEDKSTQKRYRADKIIHVTEQSELDRIAAAHYKDRDKAFQQILEGITKSGWEGTQGNYAWDTLAEFVTTNKLGLYFVEEETKFIISAEGPRGFNLMFKTHQGSVEDAANAVYLRPETAQGIFLNFKNVLDTTRVKIPFGIAQIGKSFRNEITPGNFTFRTREFEQFEMEFFARNAAEAATWFDTWVDTRFDWYVGLGIKAENLRLRPHAKEELAHYAAAATDVEYNFPFGFSELEGIANRGDYDLSQHEKASGVDLKYFDDETKEKYLPHVVEPAGGVDRAVLAFLVDAYTKEKVGEEERVVMKFHPRLAPIKVAVFPLIKKDEVTSVAKEIYEKLREKYFVEYDESGTVGKRYRRHDEIGTPYCITVDFDGLEDNTVTVRDRDTMKQERVEVAELEEWLARKLG